MTNPTTPKAAPKPLTRRQLDALGNEAEGLLEVITTSTARLEEIKQKLRDNLDFGAHVAGNLKVSIQHNVSRDDKAIVAAYPAAAHPELYKLAIDGTALKKNLTGAQYEAFQKEGAPKVILDVFEDGK